MARPSHNLSNRIFGFLTVKIRVGNKNGAASWACVCSCGKILNATARNLLTGNTQSCGCFRTIKRHRTKHFIDLSGQQIGKWEVQRLDDIKTKSEGDAYWFCQCSCGDVFSVLGRSLRKGISNGCRACRKSGAGSGPKNYVLTCYKYNARQRKIPWKISNEFFFELTQQNCHYCGASPSMISKMRGKKQTYLFFHNGVDRVDNFKGYVEGNVVSCCKICNNAKGTLSITEFSTWINRIASKFFDHLQC